MRGTRVAAVIIAGAGLAMSSTAAAQSSPPGFMEEFQGQFGASAQKLVALARAMPASTYDWSPGDEVAGVARVYMHIARYNYMYPHENMGRESPVPPAEYARWEDEVTDKDEVVEILEASMEYVRGVAESMSSDDIDEATMLYGRSVGEWAVLLQLVTHMNEHLGQSIAYARMNGVVPPWSR
ncbi:MAG: DinB family protein [Gemmatimonadetes bacterium]|nr:DinB family protein [Gemmatimonadota bacterium]